MAVASTASPTLVLDTKRGKQILALLLAVAFLDFVDASIVNVALPSIRADLGLHRAEPAVGAQRLPADLRRLHAARRPRRRPARPPPRPRRRDGAVRRLLARRRARRDAAMLIGARLVQGVGAAMMLPAALSILTTTFSEASDRNKALGAWGAIAGLASAVGVFLGGVLTDGPGWRWVFFVNLPVASLILRAMFRLLPADERAERSPELRRPRRPARHRRDAAARLHDRRGARRRLGRRAGPSPASRAPGAPRALRSPTSAATATRCSRSRSSGSRASRPPT